MTTATTDLSRIAALVRKHRTELGWRQHQLAQAAEVSLATVQIIENAQRRSHDSTYGRIARALGIPLGDLLDRGEA